MVKNKLLYDFLSAIGCLNIPCSSTDSNEVISNESLSKRDILFLSTIASMGASTKLVLAVVPALRQLANGISSDSPSESAFPLLPANIQSQARRMWNEQLPELHRLYGFHGEPLPDSGDDFEYKERKLEHRDLLFFLHNLTPLLLPDHRYELAAILSLE
jgi:hypothetical protein